MPDSTDWQNRWKSSSSCATLEDMQKKEPTEAEQNLRACRSEIDEIDLKIGALLARRHELVVEIGKQKNVLGVQVTDNKREIYVLDRTSAQGHDEHGARFIRDVYTQILRVSRAAQNPAEESPTLVDNQE